MSTTTKSIPKRRQSKTVTVPMLKGELTRRSAPKGERRRPANYIYGALSGAQIKALIDGTAEFVDHDFNSGRKVRVRTRDTKVKAKA